MSGTVIQPSETVDTREFFGTKAEYLVDQVTQRLISQMSSDDRKQELRDAFDVAVGFIDKLDLKEELLDPNNVGAQERALLVMSIAPLWKRAVEIGDFREQRKLAKQLSQIYVKAERQYIMSGPKVTGCYMPKEVSDALIKHFWPESNGDENWLKKNIMRDDPFIYFPVSLNKG